MRIIGIDPGKSGAIAVLDEGKYLASYFCPTIEVGDKNEYDERSMAGLIKMSAEGCDELRIVLERVHAMPLDSTSGAFSFGTGYGIWKGIIAALEIPFQEVSPQRWMKQMLQDVPRNKAGKDKQRSVVAARRIFPTMPLTRKKDEALAEAALIAAFGHREIWK